MAGKIYKNSFKLNDAWGDGRRAAQTGQLVGTNPFISGIPAYQAWIDGFNNTFA
jgi:hypothetical protein